MVCSVVVKCHVSLTLLSKPSFVSSMDRLCTENDEVQIGQVRDEWCTANRSRFSTINEEELTVEGDDGGSGEDIRVEGRPDEDGRRVVTMPLEVAGLVGSGDAGRRGEFA